MFWFGFIKYLTCVKEFFTIFSTKANTACCILEWGLIRDVSPVETIRLSRRMTGDLSAPRPNTWQGALCAAWGRENSGDVSNYQAPWATLTCSMGNCANTPPGPTNAGGQHRLQGSCGSHGGCFCPETPCSQGARVQAPGARQGALLRNAGTVSLLEIAALSYNHPSSATKASANAFGRSRCLINQMRVAAGPCIEQGYPDQG